MAEREDRLQVGPLPIGSAIARTTRRCRRAAVVVERLEVWLVRLTDDDAIRLYRITA
jgi:hypothetical protein